jgi:predicted DNA-binding transcriptional regulator YafY
MYFPTTRVLTVLELLQSRRSMSGPELAGRLEVNIRTVRRYITMLQDLGIPVETERGRYGSYRLRPGFKLPPLMFTDEETLAVTLGLLAARKLGLAVAAPAVEGALAKIERVLPATLRERVQAIQNTLSLDVRADGVAPDSAIISALCAAAQRERRVWLRYQAYESDETEREVDLYGLVYHNGFWYAVGYCHLRHDVRVFRLDRIVRAEERAETYQRPADFDCMSHVTRSIATMPDKWLAEVELETSLECARQMVPPTMATLEQSPGGVLLRCYTHDMDWMAARLAGLNCAFTIHQPSELRDAILRLADRLSATARP